MHICPHLSRVLEGALNKLGSDLLDIDVGQNNGSVVPAEFESDPFQSLRSGLHDFLTRWDGAGKGDLVDVRVLGEPRSELVVATNGLNNSWREDLLGQLNDL